MFNLLKKKPEIIHYHPGIYNLQQPYMNHVRSVAMCDVEICVPPGYYPPTVIITSHSPEEIKGNSITNNFEHIATSVAKTCFKWLGVQPKDVVWLELYPESWGKDFERFSMVKLEWDEKNQEYHSPDWCGVPEGFAYSLELKKE